MKKVHPKLTAEFTEIDFDKAVEIAGIREASPEDTCPSYKVMTKDGPIRVVMDNNGANRPFKLSDAEKYGKTLLSQKWASQKNHLAKTPSGQSWEVDWNGQIISCAHRCMGIFIAEHERRRLKACGMDDRIEDLGCKSPIKVKALLVLGLDPLVADNSDTGRSRKLEDVLFRRREFNGKEVSENVLKRLSKELAVTIRLVWLRTNGYRVARGPALSHEEALEFLEDHPLLHDALLHVYHENGGEGSEGKKITGRVTLGYAAAFLYLFAHQESDPAKVDYTKKPKGWAAAENFWTLFAQDLHTEENPIKSLHKVLTDNKKNEHSYDRDTVCTLICRAWLSAAEIVDAEKWNTPRKLSSRLFMKKDDKKILNFERIGGVDLDREVLKEAGLVSDDKIFRKNSDGWKIGDTCFVDQRADEGVGVWYGRIDGFSDTGKEALVFCHDDDQTWGVDVKLLCIENPEEGEENGEEVEEEELETVEA